MGAFIRSWLSAPLLMLAALITSPPFVDAAVFGPDDRLSLPIERRPLASSIGTLVSSKTKALCSAFCLAPDIIGTASHCVFGTNDENEPPLTSLTFSLADAPGSPSSPIAGGAIAAEAQNVIAGSTRLRLTPPIGAAKDWAVVRLEKPVCGGAALPITRSPRREIDASAEAGRMYQVAMHRDIAARSLQFDGACRTLKTAGSRSVRIARNFADWRKIMLHGCDTGGGSSGSPMLIDRDGRPEVVAVNVGVYVASHGLISAAIGDDTPPKPIANTAIDITSMARAFETLRSRDLVTTPDDVRRIQTRLQSLAVYRGPVSGRVDAMLAESIRAYERSRALPETGLVTKALLDELELATSVRLKR